MGELLTDAGVRHYNDRTMCSRLVASFLLALLAWAALFVPGGEAQARPADPVAVVLEAQARDATPDAALLGVAADLGAADSTTDLPEVILSLAPAAAPRHGVSDPQPPSAHKRVQPTLDGLRRPPRFAFIA